MPGDDHLGDSQSTRGFIRIPESGPDHRNDFAKDASLVIFQHPKGGVMQFASSQFANIRLNRNKSRITYSASTEPGSAGAPCFNSKLEFVAIHQAKLGVTDSNDHVVHKQGIPIDKIRELLQARGKWEEIY